MKTMIGNYFNDKPEQAMSGKIFVDVQAIKKLMSTKFIWGSVKDIIDKSGGLSDDADEIFNRNFNLAQLLVIRKNLHTSITEIENGIFIKSTNVRLYAKHGR